MAKKWQEIPCKKTIPFPLWRWQLDTMQYELSELIDENFSPTEIQCSFYTSHWLYIFSTLYLVVNGERAQILRLARLIREKFVK